MQDAWKPVVATLVDAERRLLLARITVAAAGDEPLLVDALPSADRRRLTALERTGLVALEGGVAHPADPFSPLLTHRPAASGIERFLRDGRIVAWPRRASDRDALLAWAADRAAGKGERLDERTVTERLAAVADDPATLRRDLCDAGLLQRAADGAAYWRAP